MSTVAISKQADMPAGLLQQMLEENQQRLDVLQKTYNPVTGENSPGLRCELRIADFLDGRPQFIPVEMLCEDFILALFNCHSFYGYIQKYLPEDGDYDDQYETVVRHYIRLRCKYDFYFFAGCYAKIKNKEGGEDIPFLLRPAQLTRNGGGERGCQAALRAGQSLRKALSRYAPQRRTVSDAL